MNVSSKQTITLQFGNFSNFVGSHYWNQLEASNNEPSNLYRTDTSATGARRSSPRVLVFDIRDNYVPTFADIIEKEEPTSSVFGWSGKTSVVKQESVVPENFCKYDRWVDWRETAYSRRSLCQLPRWQTSINDQFNFFYSGDRYKGINGIGGSEQLWEDVYLENFRYYAEECDTVGTVQILTDVHNGFGGLSCSFLEMLQDEMLSSAVTVPVWALTPPGHHTPLHTSSSSTAPTLSSLNMPLLFSKMQEAGATLVAPMCAHPSGTSSGTSTWHQSSADISHAIDTLTRGYHTHSTASSASTDATTSVSHATFAATCRKVTSDSRQKFCHIETLSHTLPPMEEQASSQCDLPQFFTDRMSIQEVVSSSGSVRYKNHSTLLNPFLSTSYSTAKWTLNADQVNPSPVCTGKGSGIYSNVLHVTGYESHMLPMMLYRQCVHSSYHLSNCLQSPEPTIHPLSPFHAPVAGHGPISCAAIGTDESMGEYVNQLAHHWDTCTFGKERSGASSSDNSGGGALAQQLTALTDMDADECNEIHESLINIRQR